MSPSSTTHSSCCWILSIQTLFCWPNDAHSGKTGVQANLITRPILKLSFQEILGKARDLGRNEAFFSTLWMIPMYLDSIESSPVP